MSRISLFIFLVLLASGCASPRLDRVASPDYAVSDGYLVPFSVENAGGLPAGWAPLVLMRDRPRTQYGLVRESGRTVLHARADGASSALMHAVSRDVTLQPWLQWEWKIKNWVRNPQRSAPHERASPVRIILGFDGDKETLSFSEQILFDTAKLVTGHDFPYATLMYVWSDNLAPGTVLNSRHSSRIKMIVVESGPEGVGTWRRFTRNVVADFERAFGEPPGGLLGVGVLTDTTEPGETIEAWYGDVRFSDDRPAADAALHAPNPANVR